MASPQLVYPGFPPVVWDLPLVSVPSTVGSVTGFFCLLILFLPFSCIIPCLGFWWWPSGVALGDFFFPSLLPQGCFSLVSRRFSFSLDRLSRLALLYLKGWWGDIYIYFKILSSLCLIFLLNLSVYTYTPNVLSENILTWGYSTSLLILHFCIDHTL